MVLLQGIEDLFQFIGLKQRRGPASQVYAFHLLSVQIILLTLYLPEQGPDEPVPVFVGCNGKEIAIVTFLPAVWNMNVNTCHNPYYKLTIPIR